jgi:hypothetical protein
MGFVGDAEWDFTWSRQIHRQKLNWKFKATCIFWLVCSTYSTEDCSPTLACFSDKLFNNSVPQNWLLPMPDQKQRFFCILFKPKLPTILPLIWTQELLSQTPHVVLAEKPIALSSRAVNLIVLQHCIKSKIAKKWLRQKQTWDIKRSKLIGHFYFFQKRLSCKIKYAASVTHLRRVQVLVNYPLYLAVGKRNRSHV